jgi:DNA-directed RNA polymerase specialized sigma24 family protein
LKDEDGAKDIAEDSFIKLWANMEKIKNENHAKKFLYVCAKNGCANLEAMIKRHRNEPLTIVHELLPEPDYEVIESQVLAFIAE